MVSNACFCLLSLLFGLPTFHFRYQSLFRNTQFQNLQNMRLRPTWRNIKNSINAIFLILFITHLSIICYQSLNPNVPSIRVFKQDLNHIDFPINFKVCVHELENITARYQNVGYRDNYYFYLGIGISKFHPRPFVGGWYGHTEDNKTLGYLKGLILIVKFSLFKTPLKMFFQLCHLIGERLLKKFLFYHGKKNGSKSQEKIWVGIIMIFFQDVKTLTYHNLT